MKRLDWSTYIEEGNNLPPLPDSYRWTILEFFCDGYLAYQQSLLGIHYQARVPYNYRPQSILIAFDGMPVFALEGNRVSLDRLRQPFAYYSSGKEAL